ncbi:MULTISPECIES: nuclear transport factor 2 family protein [Haloarcula]|uniref:nuclear transport factor 2 family protein n=1 Tax=Haloarcula TaxID=2237 RepID=UPI0023EC2C7F|nr:nuclear transport factor 2 family protein [Halomicroarcula sp. XH51]
MSVDIAREYFERSDDPEASVEDVVELFADDAVLKSPREGIFRGREAVREFFELNAEFFASGSHHMDRFYTDGSTVVCEGTIEGETTAGRSYEGVGLVDVMEFADGEITALRVYLDYSAILTEIPDEVPDFRD